MHGVRDAIAGPILKIPPESLRVVTQDVGGGFGTKAVVYREYPLVLEAAKRLGRPVGWQADRTEHFVGDAQGRDNVTLGRDGARFRRPVSRPARRYLGQSRRISLHVRALIPWLGASMATGPYHIGALYARVRGHLHPYGSGRRLSRGGAARGGLRARATGRRCARSLGIAPEELRARNFIKPEQMPYHTHTDRDYDVGDFEGAMRACLAKADRAGFARRAQEAQARGKIRGFGVSSYIECTAWNDSEQGSVALEKNGDFTVLIGTQSNGQGHETAYAQVVSQYLDVPLDRIKVIQGDTDRVATGAGTGASRSIPIGAVMVTRRRKLSPLRSRIWRPTSWRPRSPTWKSRTDACASPERTARSPMPRSPRCPRRRRRN